MRNSTVQKIRYIGLALTAISALAFFNVMIALMFGSQADAEIPFVASIGGIIIGIGLILFGIIVRNTSSVVATIADTSLVLSIFATLLVIFFLAFVSATIVTAIHAWFAVSCVVAISAYIFDKFRGR